MNNSAYLSPNILKQAQDMRQYLVDVRRSIHANPELSFEEGDTAAFVAGKLRELGFDVKTGIGRTGLIADLGTGDKIVAIRADMDALPIQESNEVAYCSKRNGVMHACGHDAHTACVLGAARLLKEHFTTTSVNGRVRFIFQPAEERANDAGKSGATLMIEDGAIEGVRRLIGLHVHPGFPTGLVGLRNGPILAACDSFEVTITGKGCHGAEPHLGIDAVVLAGNAIQAIHQIVSRRVAATDAAVVTIGGVRTNTYAANIVAEEVQMTGTVRYFNVALHEKLKLEVERALSTVTALGGKVDLKYRNDSPALINDPAVAEKMREAAASVLGAETIVEIPQHMGAEDFSFYTQHVPSCFLVLGVGIDGSPRELHTSSFDINEDALPIGAAILAESALRLIAEQND